MSVDIDASRALAVDVDAKTREIIKAGLLGRPFGILDKENMVKQAKQHMASLQIGICSMTQV